MFKIVNENKIEKRKFGNIRVRDLIKKSSVSIAEITLKGKNLKNVNTKSDSFYYVIEGSGIFVISGKKINVKKGNLIYISKGTPYQDSGNLKLICVCSPCFNRRCLKKL